MNSTIMNTKTKVAGLGYYVPERIVKNSDLEAIMDTTDAWIIERTGMATHIWRPQQPWQQELLKLPFKELVLRKRR